MPPGGTPTGQHAQMAKPRAAAETRHVRRQAVMTTATRVRSTRARRPSARCATPPRRCRRTRVCTNCHGQPHGDLSAAHTASEPGGMTWANNGRLRRLHSVPLPRYPDEHAKASSGSLGCAACHAAGGPVQAAARAAGTGSVRRATARSIRTTTRSTSPTARTARVPRGSRGRTGLPSRLQRRPAAGRRRTRETLPCHAGPDYVPYPQLGPP